jgi:hypothetical protein
MDRLMAKDEFIQNLRLAAGSIAPRVQTSGTELDAGSMSARLARAALWLTPRAVEGFDADDFNDLPEAERDELRNSVAAFRNLADTIPALSPPTDEQYWNGGNLELTYLIRLFAEFESGLRSCWERSLKRTTQPPVRDLLYAIAKARSIPHDLLDDVHEVRKLRNAFVHESDGTEVPLSLAEARSRLCIFLAWLPPDW